MEILGISNLLTDLIINVTNEELDKTGMVKGEWNPSNSVPRDGIDLLVSKSKALVIPGGSPANTMMNLASMGEKVGLVGSLAHDEYGHAYMAHLKHLSIETWVQYLKGHSGISVIFVTPDFERTMYADLGVADRFTIHPITLESPRILHTSSYEIDASNNTIEAMRVAKRKGLLMSFDLASPAAIRRNREQVTEAVGLSDLLFMTEEEGEEFTGIGDRRAMWEVDVPLVAYKMGAKGSICRNAAVEEVIPVYPAKVVNTNGAGDSYAAGFLYGVLRGFSWVECGHWASFVASRVVAQKEPHLMWYR